MIVVALETFVPGNKNHNITNRYVTGGGGGEGLQQRSLYNVYGFAVLHQMNC